MENEKTAQDKRAILKKLFFSTLYLSTFTFGGGYVIVSLLKTKFVDELHWIDENEMLDLIFSGCNCRQRSDRRRIQARGNARNFLCNPRSDPPTVCDHHCNLRILHSI